MYPSESIHKYPRLLTLSTGWLCAALVALTSANLGFIFLRAIWALYGRDDSLIQRVPLLPGLVNWIAGDTRAPSAAQPGLVATLLPALGWAALALLAAIVLRNAFPVIRASSRGMLVEFAGNWLPVPWENLTALKVTEDLAGERFVLLAQTDPRQLTTWHRLYSLFYGLNWRPGFYITSTISEFDQLVQTVLTESERTARAVESARAVRLQENAQSPLFRLLLSPGSFFSRRAASDAGTTVSTRPSAKPGDPVSATYPPRITALVGGAFGVLTFFALWRYLSYWARLLALEIPGLRTVPPWSWNLSDPRYIELYNAFRSSGVPFGGVAGRPDLPAPWWLLVAAHLMLLLAGLALLWLRNLLPSIESRADGLAVRDTLRGRWHLLPWASVKALKLTEFSEQSQILLLQGRGLPASQAPTSLLYDGSPGPGVLITSAISNFQPMLQHALGNLAPLEREEGQPILRQDARSWLLWLAFGRRPARDALVAEARADERTRAVSAPVLLRAARTMAAIAAPPALLIVLGGLLGDSVPSVGLLFGAAALWLFGMLEWPLVGLISVLLDDNTGGGEEGYRALAIYPTSQLPRLLPLAAAVVLQLTGVPVLPVVAWVGAIAWSFWLGAGLWETLYEWRGSQSILGGLLPVFWQLLLLIGYLVAAR